MDKKSYVFQEIKEETFVYDDKIIKIKPYLSFGEQLLLIKSYIETCFDDQSMTKLASLKSDRFGAEWIMMLTVIDMCTDIEVDELRDYDYHLYRIWHIVQDKIINYNDFISILNKSVEEYMNERNSISSILERLMKEFEDNFGEEKLQALKSELVSIVEKFKSLPLSNLQS